MNKRSISQFLWDLALPCLSQVLPRSEMVSLISSPCCQQLDSATANDRLVSIFKIITSASTIARASASWTLVTVPSPMAAVGLYLTCMSAHPQPHVPQTPWHQPCLSSPMARSSLWSFSLAGQLSLKVHLSQVLVQIKDLWDICLCFSLTKIA